MPILLALQPLACSTEGECLGDHNWGCSHLVGAGSTLLATGGRRFVSHIRGCSHLAGAGSTLQSLWVTFDLRGKVW